MLDLLPQTQFAEDQQNSQEILYAHGILKGVQAGSFLGTAIGYPASLWFKNPRILNKTLGVSLALMPIVVSGMIYGKMQGKDLIEWQDRAWRLQRNANQVSIDYFATAGGVIGLGLKRSPVGLGLGTLAGMATFGVYTQIKKTL